MKRYIKKIQKKLLIKLKKSRSDNDQSFSSGSSSDNHSSDSINIFKKSGTPTTVLPSKKHRIGNYMITNDFVHAFQMMDRNGDGKIKMEELHVLLSRVGGKINNNLTDEDIKLMLTEVDRDGDGCISLEELSVIGSALLENPSPTSTCDDELRETFDFFDVDHDGKIYAEELFNVFKTIVGEGGITLDECKRMIKSVDRNMNGFVCYEDFSRMMEINQRL